MAKSEAFEIFSLKSVRGEIIITRYKNGEQSLLQIATVHPTDAAPYDCGDMTHACLDQEQVVMLIAALECHLSLSK